MPSVRRVLSSAPLLHSVMPGLVPGISLRQLRQRVGKCVDGRNECGHDATGVPRKCAITSKSGHRMPHVVRRDPRGARASSSFCVLEAGFRLERALPHLHGASTVRRWGPTVPSFGRPHGLPRPYRRGDCSAGPGHVQRMRPAPFRDPQAPGARFARSHDRGRERTTRAETTKFKPGFAGIKWDKWDSAEKDRARPKGRARAEKGSTHGATLALAARAMHRTMVQALSGPGRRRGAARCAT